MEFQGVFFKGLKRTIGRLPAFRYRTPRREAFIEPAVYICRHENMRGPILSMANFPIPVHPWVFHVFCNKDDCYKHYSEYTFSVRFKWEKWKSNAVSWLVASGVAKLVNSAGGIPVYRNSSKVMSTFRISMEALKRGEGLLIFPEVDYTAEKGEVGKMYEGFLMLEKMYLKETGKHLPFVPLHIDDRKKEIVLGEAIYFPEGMSFNEGRADVIRQLQEALNEMSRDNSLRKDEQHAAF